MTHIIKVPVKWNESWLYEDEMQVNPLHAEKLVLLRRIREIEALESDLRLSEIDPEAYKLRLSRRSIEKKDGVVISCGPWDVDLDKYHSSEDINVPLPPGLEGYRAYACRNFHTWTWNGYVVTPEGHVMRELENYCGDRHPPQEVTYKKDGIFGWDHARSHECCPLPRRHLDPPHKSGYITFEGISTECIEFAKWLKSVDDDNKLKKNTTVSTDEWITVKSRRKR